VDETVVCDVADAFVLGVAMSFLRSPYLFCADPKTIRAADRRHVNEIYTCAAVHLGSAKTEGGGGGGEGRG
jgi:hypothetical protein